MTVAAARGIGETEAERLDWERDGIPAGIPVIAIRLVPLGSLNYVVMLFGVITQLIADVKAHLRV